ncbi:MAG TPA: hypothetical protein VL523_04425 [Terriglobia bacterium]|nr:hypothetical protein [Terriglobia bacterium]
MPLGEFPIVFNAFVLVFLAAAQKSFLPLQFLLEELAFLASVPLLAERFPFVALLPLEVLPLLPLVLFDFPSRLALTRGGLQHSAQSGEQ